jgi:hypothetical protein
MKPLPRKSLKHPWPRHTAIACALMAVSWAASAQQAPSPVSSNETASSDVDVRPGERLSTWLLRQPADASAPGLAWRVPQERLAQQFLKNTLLLRIETATRRASQPEQAERYKLIRWLQGLPVTGRVALGIVDARWLQAHPEEDPVLTAGQTLVAPQPRLKTVAVVRANGELCQVAHEAGRSAWDYIVACDLQAGYDWAWVAQPDGRTARVGVAPWTGEPSDEPAPGAWIWAAPRSMGDLVAASEGIIKFLATQGPSPQGTGAMEAATPSPAAAPVAGALPSPLKPPAQPGTTISVRPEFAPRYQAVRTSANDWGETGLLQTPSARMGVAGDFRTSFSNVSPYMRLNFMFQPFDWLEAGFRYTSVNNRIYGISDQDYKDKSIDFKARLLKESAYIPELAVGFRDVGGTGLFSAEYLVANKRYGDLDFSLGIGWGYLGNSGNVSNPFNLLGDRFRTRPAADNAVVNAGRTNFGSLFRGPAALFGGVQWRTPWEPLTVKLEYEGNNYQNEPLKNNLPQRTPFNIGLEYRYSPNVAFSAGFERGNKVMVGVTLSSKLAALSSPKLADPPAPRFTPDPPANPPGWASTAAEIENRTDWTVQRIAPQNAGLHIWITESNTVYREARVQQIIAVLHRDAPASAKTFIIHYNERGLAMGAQVVERAEWVAEHYQARSPAEVRATSQREYAPPGDNSEDRLLNRSVISSKSASSTVNAPATKADPTSLGAWQPAPKKFEFGITPSFGQIVGGPDAFVLYQLGVAATVQYRFTPSTWVNGALNWRLLDNFDKFTYTAPSNLPRVRTYQREYVTTSRLTMPVLQLTHVGRLTDNQYYSVYGGALESMYAGVGAEWLYRPWRSNVAFGVDINRVRQRAFEQDFGLRDYKVTTGHATMYWNTGWNGVIATVSAGQYLAGDKGVTLNISRVFDNGVAIGAYVTKTNLSSKQFGEGSFDKGIYFSIPFDALLPRSSKFSANFTWAPLVRDGGAKLGRINQLYDMTAVRDNRAFDFGAPAMNNPRAGDNILNFERSAP